MVQDALWLLPEDLADLYRDDRECVVAILETFVEQIGLSLERIRARVESGEAVELARELHRLKGSLLQLGAMETGAKCKAFERAVPAEPPVSWYARLDTIESECREILAEVAGFLRRAG